MQYISTFVTTENLGESIISQVQELCSYERLEILPIVLFLKSPYLYLPPLLSVVCSRNHLSVAVAMYSFAGNSMLFLKVFYASYFENKVKMDLLFMVNVPIW